MDKIIKNRKTILEIADLEVHFKSDNESIKAVNKISLSIKSNEIVALVGESGSGKSITALSITKIAPRSALFLGGKIIFENKDLLSLSESYLQKIRGKKIAYIFQEPMVSFNPVFTVGVQIQESIRLHNINNISSKNYVKDLFDKVHLPNRLFDSYPHQMSGGQLQRCMIAMALACSPDLLIADEPTTALDVTIQKEILNLLSELRLKENLSILLITHNFGVVSELADRVYVMQSGKIVESGITNDIINNPSHSYTQKLMKSVPRLNRE